MKKVQANIEGKTYLFELSRIDGGLRVKRDDVEHAADLVRLKNNRYSLIIGGRSFEFGVDFALEGYVITSGSRSGNVRVEDYELAQVKKAAGITDTVRIKSVSAPMPGMVVQVHYQPGHQVNKGDPLVVMEAMKMENDIKSPLSGKIRAVRVSAGQSVEKGQVLVEFE